MSKRNWHKHRKSLKIDNGSSILSGSLNLGGVRLVDTTSPNYTLRLGDVSINTEVRNTTDVIAGEGLIRSGNVMHVRASDIRVNNTYLVDAIERMQVQLDAQAVTISELRRQQGLSHQTYFGED